MKVLVLNAGSSSLKFTFYSMTNELVVATGQVERLGSNKAQLIYKRPDGFKEEIADPAIKDHISALKSICSALTGENGVIKDLAEVEAIGHRVVHGGERATKPIMVDGNVKQIIRDCFALAPLHNPANLSGIEACEEIFPNVPNIAVFDTAYHQTMAPEAYLYAVPYELYTKYGIRRYGFHGTSHHFVARATAKFLEIPYKKLRLITCHLGNGCSMALINNGHVEDTTMGMTPLEGLVMGTRCGDLDPAVVLRLIELGKDAREVNNILNKQSGLLGVGGIGSSDMRDIIEATEAGDQQAQRAMRMFIRRIIKYIGGYYTLIGGADAVVFTGGIGEYSAYIRNKIVRGLGALNIRINKKMNAECLGKPGIISTDDSACKAVVMPTDEELMIARSALKTLNHD